MSEAPLIVFALALGGFLLVVIGVQIARGSRPIEEDPQNAEPVSRARLLEMAPGEAPATALLVADAEAMTRALEAQICGCGVAGPLEAEIRRTELVLGGRPLTSTRWACRCGEERTVYFEIHAA